jgi:GNAT superfamily N-acetyltransferase
MMSVVSVRPARPGDERALAEVRVRAWQVAYQGILAASELDAMSVDQDTARFESLLLEHTGLLRMLVVEAAAEQQPRLAGFCSLGPYRTVSGPALQTVTDAEPGTVGEINALYLHPDLWGSGLADELMVEVLRVLRADDWSMVRLWVLEQNARARRFYAPHGWTSDGERRTLPMSGSPVEVRMQRSVSR